MAHEGHLSALLLMGLPHSLQAVTAIPYRSLLPSLVNCGGSYYAAVSGQL